MKRRTFGSSGYYVAAEAFTNAAKHAAASAVDILIERAHGALTVQVRDDGVGGADYGAHEERGSAARRRRRSRRRCAAS
jgi:signal transduction histidine kinase